ncbi:MAG: pyridoxamine 5'-phosphate oxidase family protein [Alteraurantiacibacter sp.]
MSTTEDLTRQFWNALAASPFVFLQRNGAPDTAMPMTAQLDKDADGAIWFFTRKNHPLAPGGPATATFAAKDNQLFARLDGYLVTETRREKIDQHWSSQIESWFPGGKDDPQVLLLRMDLDQAEIWNSDLGLIDNVKMLLGFDVHEKAQAEHTETML